MNKKLDPELLAYFYDIKAKISDEHKAYFQAHPEIRQLLTDFLLKVMLTKPENTYQFARNYFSYFEKKSLSQKLRHLVIVGPKNDGKSKLIKMLIENYPQYFEENIILTTRKETAQKPTRKQEERVTEEQIEEEAALGNLIELEDKDGVKTAMSKSRLEETLRRGKVCVLKTDISTAKKLVEAHPDFNVILIIPGSLESLKEALLNKGKVGIGKIDEIMNGIKLDLEESSKLHMFSKRILNITPERSFEQLMFILKFYYKQFNF